MTNLIKTILEEYNHRIEAENALMRSLPMKEGMKRRDEFLLSVGEETAIFLNNLVKAAKPKTVLEIGTSYGYSTIWLAEAAQSYGGKVISLENDSQKANFAKNKLNQAGLSETTEIIVGDALNFLENNTTFTFDFVLLDLWKELYIPCFDLFFPKLNEGAYVISDNMLFPPHSRAEMDIYRKHLKETNAFDSVLLPIGSGIEVSQKQFTNFD
jgi:predicted O-methyltransferase YrrM